MHFRLFFVLVVSVLTTVGWAADTNSVSAPEPIFKWSDSTRLGRPLAKDPGVVRLQDRYLMFFSLPPFDPSLAPSNAPSGWSIGIAQSRNMRDWEKVSEYWPEQECELKGMCAPAPRIIKGKIHLFYNTYGNGPKDGICHAVSEDGIRFTRDDSNPVFRPSGKWNNGRAIDSEVVVHQDRVLLYFATRDPAGQRQMLGVAAAPLNSDLSRSVWKQVCTAPVLAPELPWEKRCVEAPTVIRRGADLVMFYAGGYNNDPQQIGAATSADGLTWKRLSDQPLLPNGAPGSWNSSESGHPGCFEDQDGRTYLFFQGNPDKGRTWHLACLEIEWSGNQPRIKRSATLPSPNIHLR